MKTRFANTGIACITLAALALLSNQASAANFTWDGTTNQNSNTATNWVGGAAPSNNTADVFFSGNPRINYMLFNPNGSGQTWKSITFSTDNNFSINRSANTGILGTYFGGITAAASGTTLRTYYIQDEFRVDANQTWTTSNQYSKLVVTQATGNLALGANTLTLDTFNNADSTIIIGSAISGTGAITKTNGGTAILSGANTYTGATTVSAGTLVVNGSIASSSSTTVSSGATIGGSGTVGALTVSTGGSINPGNSPGILSTGDYSQAGTYNAEITGLTAGTEHDQINVTGTVDITGGSLSALFSGGTYAANDLIFILLNDSSDAIVGTFNGLVNGATVTNYGGYDWIISYLADSTGTPSFTGGNDIALKAVVVAIPEPNFAALLGGFGVLLLFRRRR